MRGRLILTILFLLSATIPEAAAENADGSGAPELAERSGVWTSVLEGHRVEASRSSDETSFLIGVTLEPGSPLDLIPGNSAAFRLVLDEGDGNPRIAHPLTGRDLASDNRLTFLLTDVGDGNARLSFDIEVLVEHAGKATAVIASAAVIVEPLRAGKDPHIVVHF